MIHIKLNPASSKLKSHLAQTFLRLEFDGLVGLIDPDSSVDSKESEQTEATAVKKSAPSKMNASPTFLFLKPKTEREWWAP